MIFYPGSTSPGKIGGTGTQLSSVRVGTSGALVAGVLSVADTGVTAASEYFFTAASLGTVAVPSTYYVSARTVGVSFTITASVSTDTSTINWVGFN